MGNVGLWLGKQRRLTGEWKAEAGRLKEMKDTSSAWEMDKEMMRYEENFCLEGRPRQLKKQMQVN